MQAFFSLVTLYVALHLLIMASLGSGINVRLDTDTKQRLDVVAELSGIKASNLIRQAVNQFLDEVERDGRLSIEIDIPKSSPSKLEYNTTDGKPPRVEIVPINQPKRKKTAG